MKQPTSMAIPFPGFSFRFFLPLIKAGVGVAAFFCFSWWSCCWLGPPTSVNAKPITAIMTRTVSASGMDWATLAAAGVLTIVPGAIVIWFVRKLHREGFRDGSCLTGALYVSMDGMDHTRVVFFTVLD